MTTAARNTEHDNIAGLLTRKDELQGKSRAAASEPGSTGVFAIGPASPSPDKAGNLCDSLCGKLEFIPNVLPKKGF